MNNKLFSFRIRMHILGLALAGVLAGILASGAARAETVYLTDILQLELYETMEMTGRPLKRLRSGDRMEVLKREGRYARVRLDDGATGWVQSLYLVDKEPARTQLNKIDAELNEARAKIAVLEEALAAREQELGNLVDSQEGSASAEEAMAAELELLRIQKSDLQSRVNAYAGSVPISWLFISLIATLITGFIAGWYYIDYRSRARHGGYRVY